MREQSELISLFGRAEVDRASVHCGEIRAWVSADVGHRVKLIRAMRELREAIARHPHQAVDYCQRLDPNLKGLIILELLES